jgi:hypothetical protein
MHQAFSGGDFDSTPLTAVQQPREKRLGRRKALSDGELWGDRNAWLDMLQKSWAHIGWEIGRAKSVQQLRRAFLPVQDYSGRLQFFVRPSISKASTQMARLTQRRLGHLNERIRLGYEQERALHERLERAKNALQQAKDESETAQIKSICQDRDHALQASSANYEKLQQEERDLRDQMMNQWAYIAQSELLAFIHSHRYTINPVNLANAMAGLPNMGWRQSTKRCQKLEKPLGPGFGYLTVKLIERVNNKSSKKKFLVILEADLKKQPKRNFAAQEMKKNWYYLRAAIKEVLQQKIHPGKIPYRVVAEYQRKMSSRTAVDFLFEEEEQLV